MMRMLIVTAVILAATNAVAGPAGTGEPARRAEFLEGVPPALTDADLQALPANNRPAVRVLTDICRRWANAPDMAAQRAMEPELDRVVQAAARDIRIFGGIMEREFSGDRASLQIRIGGRVLLRTAGVGFLSFDPHDTRIVRGSDAFRVLANAAPGDVVLARVSIIGTEFDSGDCGFLVRVRELRLPRP